jgi:hypothetical protein
MMWKRDYCGIYCAKRGLIRIRHPRTGVRPAQQLSSLLVYIDQQRRGDAQVGQRGQMQAFGDGATSDNTKPGSRC